MSGPTQLAEGRPFLFTVFDIGSSHVLYACRYLQSRGYERLAYASSTRRAVSTADIVSC